MSWRLRTAASASTLVLLGVTLIALRTLGDSDEGRTESGLDDAPLANPGAATCTDPRGDVELVAGPPVEQSFADLRSARFALTPKSIDLTFETWSERPLPQGPLEGAGLSFGVFIADPESGSGYSLFVSNAQAGAQAPQGWVVVRQGLPIWGEEWAEARGINDPISDEAVVEYLNGIVPEVSGSQLGVSVPLGLVPPPIHGFEWSANARFLTFGLELEGQDDVCPAGAERLVFADGNNLAAEHQADAGRDRLEEATSEHEPASERAGPGVDSSQPEPECIGVSACAHSADAEPSLRDEEVAAYFMEAWYLEDRELALAYGDKDAVAAVFDSDIWADGWHLVNVVSSSGADDESFSEEFRFEYEDPRTGWLYLYLEPLGRAPWYQVARVRFELPWDL